MSKKDITSLVQRLDAFEERLGVRIEAMSAFQSEKDSDGEVNIVVRGELHAVSGTSLDNDVDLEISVFAADGRVVETASDYIESDSFFGFHTFQISCYVDGQAPKKLRLIPKPS